MDGLDLDKGGPVVGRLRLINWWDVERVITTGAEGDVTQTELTIYCGWTLGGISVATAANFQINILSNHYQWFD